MTLGGYYLGNIPVIRRNFEKVVIGIVLVTLFVVVPWLVRHPPNDLPVRAPTLAQQ